MQKITPFLWFNNNAEEAVNFYAGLFKDAVIETITRYGEAGPGPAGSVMTIKFQLHGQEFLALNGGPHFSFTPAISFVISCETQEEIDRLWDAFTDGGETMNCGWVKDRFGLCWQVVPSIIGKLMSDKDPARVKRVMGAMMQMIKLDIAGLQRAYDGG